MTPVTQPIGAGGRPKRHVGIAIALLLGGVTSLVVLWAAYQAVMLLVLVAVPTVLEVITGVS
jgi:hypothetical protein